MQIEEWIDSSSKDRDYMPVVQLDNEAIMVTLVDFMKLQPPMITDSNVEEDP